MLDGRVDSCGQTDPSERRRPWRSWIGDPSCGSDSGDAPGSGVVYTPHSPIACHRCDTQCLLQHVVENGRESIPSQSVGTMALGPLEESVCGLMMALGVTAAVGTLRSRWLHTKSDVPPSDSASCAPGQPEFKGRDPCRSSRRFVTHTLVAQSTYLSSLPGAFVQGTHRCGPTPCGDQD